MTQPVGSVAREQVYRSLVPFFLEAADGNAADARAAAEELVDAYNPTNAEEFLLAAELVTYSMAGLESLRRSAEKPDLPVNTHLRLRGNANTMQRASQKCRAALDQRRKSAGAAKAAAPQGHTFTDADLRAAVERATAIVEEARAAGQLPPMNRQARRAAKFEAKRAIKHAAAHLSSAAA